MRSRIVWLRISYWVGAIADFVLAIIVLIPERMGVPSYCHPMGLMSAAAFSWGLMLIWADRKPLERKWILIPTMIVVLLLLAASIYSLSADAIEIEILLPYFIIQPALIALFGFSYYIARDAG
jgi:hypothetical protein